MIAISDFKYAIRLLSKSPGFTILTTLVMAAGIGLSVYLLSFMNAAIFKALPFKDGGSLVKFDSIQNGIRYNNGINLHDYYEIRTNLKGISEYGAYFPSSVNVSDRDGARRYYAVIAEPNIFQITRTKPILGREFTNAENQVGADNVVVIGYDLWQNHFGDDAQVIGQSLRVNSVNHRIIGVMPEGYLFPHSVELWMPMRKHVNSLTRDNAGNVYGIAQLEDGVSMEDVNRELTVIMQRLEEKYPKTNTGITAFVDTLPMHNVGDSIAVVYSMQVAAILILILASINVGNLLLSRAVERGKETAIRVALGAPRSRLISQMLWESIIICSVGGIIGLLLTAWGLEVTNVIVPTFFDDRPPFYFIFGLDSFTLKLFLCFVLSTIILTGLLPAWRNSGADFNSVLRDGTRGALGKKAGRLNRLLVISEIFLSVTVLIVAGQMIVSSYLATHADYGADTDNILTAEVLLPESSYDSPEKQIKFARTLQSRLGNSVGVGDVMISSALPGAKAATPLMALEGKEYTEEGSGSYPRANYIRISSGSLAKLGVELKQGRYFNSSDDGLGKRSVIVTDSFVARHFPNESPIGKRLRLVEDDGDDAEWLTILGVVEHTIQGDANSNWGRMPSVFRPFAQAPAQQMMIAIYMKVNRTVVTRTLRNTLESIDPELPAFKIDTYTDYIDRIGAPLRFMSKIFLIFGIAAVVLAAGGIYGVMSNTVNQRTQEIGVKRALGAMEQRITKEFLTTGFKQLLWGGIPGLIAGSGLGFAMSQNSITGNTELFIIALTMITIIGSVVMLATWLPTKGALQMEPGEALHYE